ncbi:uncharacterized protein [Prorops nasuta]|uniref:uncharacterized protein n=1 Tax=Prorops nasuta TaxID=863751 RepID=UPI0034CDEECD
MGIRRSKSKKFKVYISNFSRCFKMSDPGENSKYKWTPDSTALLVSVWSDKQVQKQLEYSDKPQVIWESVARYMRKKGYNVTGKNCRSRMKQLLVCYREARRAGTQAGVEQYYESIDRVLKNRKMEHVIDNGVDTVDSVNMKSPPKEIKTNKNMQMQNKYPDHPVESMYRTEALSPTWITGRENEYPDSPESNETIVARPLRMFSPTRDIGINTGEQLSHLAKQKTLTRNLIQEESKEDYRQNLIPNYLYEIPYQNAVQNVQNQIIQENMQQHQTVLQHNRQFNHRQQQNMIPGNLNYQSNFHNMYQTMGIHPIIDQQTNFAAVPPPNTENIIRQNNQLQQNSAINSNAVPQEPRRIVFGQNLAATYKRYRDILPRNTYQNENKQSGSLSPDYSSDTAPNLNDAFCQTMDSDTKIHNMNETFTQVTQRNSNLLPETTVLTNNATFNDDSFILELMTDTPPVSEAENKSRETAVNTENAPNAPFRKKKAQKLEQLVLNAINSQNEVVNKILEAQNDMVVRFLDAGKDRQDRLENRLDQLLNVVHASVLIKPPESDNGILAQHQEPAIACLSPPPKPGVIPPKLDLVPPKPCRVPCTIPSSKVELINQNPVNTRPGVVSPITTSPAPKLGSIWTRLGPVSQSPFVKAQQRLGLQSNFTTGARTQSSAERKIAKEIERLPMDMQTLIFETTKFIEIEKFMEEKIENARREEDAGELLPLNKRLHLQIEPTAAMILTSSFLQAERLESERALVRYVGPNIQKPHVRRSLDDELISGQGDGYNKLKQLDIQQNYVIDEPSDSSTPAKVPPKPPRSANDVNPVPKQTIQQLAQLVMNSQRWKDAAAQNQKRQLERGHLNEEITGNHSNNQFRAGTYVPNFNTEENQIVKHEEPRKFSWENKEGQNKRFGTDIHDGQPPLPPKPQYPIGFTRTMLDTAPVKQDIINPNPIGTIGFVDNTIGNDRKQNVRFMDEALTELQKMYMQKLLMAEKKEGRAPFMSSNENIATQHHKLIERYMQDMLKKRTRDGKDTDSDNDDEYLDTTMSMQPSSSSKKGSLTSIGTGSSGFASKLTKMDGNCIIS